MKNSGVQWIGQIPDDWKVERLKGHFSFGKGLPITKADLLSEGSAVISYGQIHSKANSGVKVDEPLIRYVSNDFLKTNPQSLVNEGDFIFADTSEDVEGCGNCVYVDKQQELFAGYHTIIARSLKNQNNKYFAYLFLTDNWRSQIREKVDGVKLFSTTQTILKQTYILLPPLSQQQKIADFLDTKCSEIQSAIDNTKQTIEEYKKLKQAVITKAVTKGIRENRKLKDSGIEWLGEISEEWESYRLKFLLNAKMQYGANSSGTLFEEALPRYVRITDIKNPYELYDEGKLSLSEDDAKGFILNDGDILFARSGATVGKSYIYNEKLGRAGFAGYLIRAICDKSKMHPNFLCYFTQSSSYDSWKEQIFIQATIQNIGADKYSNMYLIKPSLSEQQEIVNYLDKKCSQIDSLIAQKEQFIAELEKYKQSLIYEYVTGKKEVK